MDLALSTPSPDAIGVALPLLLAASLLGAASASHGMNKIGPSPAGIVASKSGTVAGYAFSAGMKNPNLIWDESTLDEFLQNPRGLVHGTKMFYRLSDPTNRQNAIAYLGTPKR
jgi:cytochrome c